MAWATSPCLQESPHVVAWNTSDQLVLSLVFTAEVFANAFCKQKIAVNTLNYSHKNIFIYEKSFEEQSQTYF